MSLNHNQPLEELKDLIQDCMEGNRFAQSRLYALLSPKLFMVCLRYSRNREEAEETLQEGFLRVFEFMHQFRFSGSFEGWARKIVVNCALQKFRSKPKMQVVSNLDNTELQDAGNEDIIHQLDAKELVKMVQELTPAYRMVFNLYVFEGYKHREIAELLGISEGTSKSNLSDARSVLQKAIKNSYSIKTNAHCS